MEFFPRFENFLLTLNARSVVSVYKVFWYFYAGTA